MQPDSNLVTLGTVAASLLGILAWVLKSALPALLKQHREDIMSLHRECAEEREKRDAQFTTALDRITERLDRGVCRHEPQPESGVLRMKKGQ